MAAALETGAGREAGALLAAGDNCWRVSRCDRAAWLINGEAYFDALAEAMSRARHRIMVLSWDLDTRIALRRGADDDGERFDHYLVALAERTPELEIYILNWDYAAIYALERQWAPQIPAALRERVHLCTDACHPPTASHHQKIVVIDDAIAFSGGLDITSHRWDRWQHPPREPGRTAPGGERYGPFHDVQALVDGEAAADLAELARERWFNATGEALEPVPHAPRHDPWPNGVTPRLHAVRVGIARTRGEWLDLAEIREVERGYLGQVRAARQYIYIQNQYFTAGSVADALVESLSRDAGPEIVIVLPERASGWLEQVTMDGLRGHAIRRLRDADRHDRLRLLHVAADDLGDEAINIHSKVMVSDDRYIRIGSANLSNRSMGLDSECDLVFEAASPDAAREFVSELLGCLTGGDPATIREAWRCSGWLSGALEASRTPRRRFADIPTPDADGAPAQLLSELYDPEVPARDTGRDARDAPSALDRWGGLRLGIVGALLLLLALAWQFGPLREWIAGISTEDLRNLVASMGPPAVIVPLLFGAASLVAFPVTLLVIGTLAIYGPWAGGALAAAGIALSASLTFLLGSLMAAPLQRRLAGTRLARLSRGVAHQGVLAMAAIRLVPVAPYSVVNLAAGASHIIYRDFLLGTLLGMLPGVAVLAVLLPRAQASLAAPGLGNIALLLGIAGAAGIGLVALRMMAKNRLEH